MIYSAYGFTFNSAFPIPALDPPLPGTTTRDLRVEIGASPDWATQALELPARKLTTRREPGPGADPQFTLTEHGEGRFFQLRYRDGTRFVVDERATRIWGEAGAGLTREDVIVYLLGPIMGFASRRRGRIVLHASALAFHGKAAALMGSAGAGKSTTAAALALRGWPVLCEDVCALEEAAGEFRVLPAYPRVCLWPDSVNALFSSPDALPLIVRGWEKRYLPLDGVRAHFASNSSPLAAIFLLAGRSAEDSAPRMEAISQREAVLQLVQNTYMNWLLDKRERAEEFDLLTRLVSTVECFRITPSADPARLTALTELIESRVAQLSARESHPARGAAQNNV